MFGSLFLSMGIILGFKFYNNRDKFYEAFNKEKVYYFLQEGVYLSKDIVNENIKRLDYYVVERKNNKYYVYIGITKDIEIARKFKNIYERLGYDIYIKEKSINNMEFDSNMSQYDLLMNNTKKQTELFTIMEVVLANYDELIMDNSY